MDHVVLMQQLINLEYPALPAEDEELVRELYEFVAHDVAIFALSIQSVPAESHLDNTPYVTGILFRIKFGRVILRKMADVGPKRYSSVGMRLGKLIVMALLRRGDIEMHTIEFLLHLFLEVARESMEALATPRDEDATE
ncbi:hypothetical protein OIDMADRAFT_57610 [Oidiodendron maius Zn]|uniref:Uncharacterized protein n=1 Tax=Oidiodendron maius (strain Zn) TaxID=913774 RepID=A0A0C3CGN1_OIDMZ|nr:hypothetical protein OIDMADRAFT_57610 [Oidiodendron maius Zn]